MRRIKKFKKSNQLIALLLAAVLSLSMGATAFAADPQATPEVATEVTEADDNVARASGIYGYAASYTNSSMDSFYVNATGTSSSSGGFTIESYSFPSSTVKIAITLCRPNGSQAKTVTLTGNQKVENQTFSNAPAGQYRVDYNIFGSSKGWLGAWVY